jgi:hypothetical protein
MCSQANNLVGHAALMPFLQRRLFHITGGYLPALQSSVLVVSVMTVRAPKNVTIPLLAFNAAR